MVSVHIDPLAIAAPYMALSALVGLLAGLVAGYGLGRRRERERRPSAG
jgi:hypothetical protein